jgi:3-methyladenine DNA glycosylase/8-oxoguanine DNA glycosylase
VPYREPFDWGAALDFLAVRAIRGVETVAEGVYARAIAFGDDMGVIRVARGTTPHSLALVIPPQMSTHAHAIAERVRRVFDLKADPAAIDAHLAHDPLLRPLVKRHPGTRVPGAWDPFETAIRAVVGQQVTVKAATTITSRLVERYGERVDAGDVEARNEERGDGKPCKLFPTPDRLANARLPKLGLPGARARTIRNVAAAVANGEVALDGSLDLDDLVERLLAIDGIGPWSAHYIAMRACAEPDAFPSGDLGVKKGALLLNPKLENEKAIREHAEAWRPWRAYAAMLLWKSLADKEK